MLRALIALACHSSGGAAALTLSLYHKGASAALFGTVTLHRFYFPILAFSLSAHGLSGFRISRQSGLAREAGPSKRCLHWWLAHHTTAGRAMFGPTLTLSLILLRLLISFPRSVCQASLGKRKRAHATLAPELPLQQQPLSSSRPISASISITLFSGFTLADSHCRGPSSTDRRGFEWQSEAEKKQR